MRSQAARMRLVKTDRKTSEEAQTLGTRETKEVLGTRREAATVVACGLDNTALRLLRQACVRQPVTLVVGHGKHCGQADLLFHTGTCDALATTTARQVCHAAELVLHANPNGWLDTLLDQAVWHERGRVISVLGARGGVGASSVAQLLALTARGPTLLLETSDSGGYGLQRMVKSRPPHLSDLGRQCLTQVADVAAEPIPLTVTCVRQQCPQLRGVWLARADSAFAAAQLRHGFSNIVVDGHTLDADRRVWVVDGEPNGRLLLRERAAAGDLVVVRGRKPVVVQVDGRRCVAGAEKVDSQVLGTVHIPEIPVMRRFGRAQAPPTGLQWRRIGHRIWRALNAE